MKELIEIQSVLNAPKSRFNSFGNYKYRSCEDILDALKPLLKQHECTLTITDSIQLIGERYYVMATAKITNSEGKAQSATAFAREEESKKGMDSAQITGSASSYARKYALNGLFLIDDVADPDTQNNSDKQTEKPKQQANAEPKKQISVEEAIILVKNAKTSAEVMKIWVDNKEIQGIPEFKEEVSKIGATLKTKENAKAE